MSRESIEEGELSSPLVSKEHHEVYASGSGGHVGANTGCDSHGGSDDQSGSSSATGVVVLSTLVAVSGSFVFGTAVSDFYFRRVCTWCHGPHACESKIHACSSV